MIRDRRMSEKQDFSDIGEKIRNAVQDAIESGDFRQINYIVNDTVGSALEEVRYQFNQMHDRLNRTEPVREKAARRPQKPARADRQAEQLPAVYFNKTGRVAGILFTVFGSIGLGIFGILTFAFLIWWIVAPGSGPAGLTVLFALLTAGCGGMLGRGCGLRARLRRAERYLKLVREKMYMRIEDLAAHTGQNVKKVRKDVRGMLNAGIFPEGHMDQKETMLVLNDATWEQYLKTRKEWEEKQRQAQAPQNAASGQKTEGTDLSAEAQMEQEGREYMDRLRQLNAQIPGEVISNKLYQLDYLLQRIFMVLKEHPQKCPQMRKFMDYYLPTTVKLVESYADFDKAGIAGDNIMTAKAEIEKTLDTINQAFEKLLDDMYQDAAFEAAADAKVLKTILAQDGYMKSEFSANAEKEEEMK